MNKIQQLNREYDILRARRLNTTPYDNSLLPKLKEMEREIKHLEFIEKEIKLMPEYELLRHGKVSIDNRCPDYNSSDPCYCCKCLIEYRERKRNKEFDDKFPMFH